MILRLTACFAFNMHLLVPQANPLGLGVLVVCGLWAYWEWRRPGGKLNPNTKYSYAR